MNFFERQDQAKRKTGKLVFLFILAMVLTFLAIHSLVALCMPESLPPGPHDPIANYWNAWLNPGLLAIDLAAVFLVIGGGSLFKMTELASLEGDGIATSLGGELIDPATTDLQEKRILNIVEEMAIASGIRVPNVYILRNEPSINAFAAGFTPETSVVAVTQGSLDYLTRDELQGVIGHEFSHILHGDTAINLRLIGVLFGLEMMVILGAILFRNSIYFTHLDSGDNDNRGAGAAIALAMLMFGIGLCIIGTIGMLVSNIIRAAISRQREYLADASAVQYTRNPSGIAGALTKIGCGSVGSSVNDSRSIEASHLFFGTVFKANSFASLFDSHPPLTSRIQAIDPSFDGSYPETLEKVGLLADPIPTSSSTQHLQGMLRQILPVPGVDGAGAAGTGGVLPAITGAAILAEGVTVPPISVSGQVGAPPVTSPESHSPYIATGPELPAVSPPKPLPQAGGREKIAQALVNSVGQVSGDNLTIANTLLASIPVELSNFVREKEGVQATVYSLLLDAGQIVRKKQMQYLSSRLEPGMIAKLQMANDLTRMIPVSAKVPVLELAFPVLRRLSTEEYKRFRSTVIELVRGDGKVDVFEFTLQEYLLRELDYQFKLSTRPQPVYKKISSLQNSFCVVMSFLAYAGNDEEQSVISAFVSGVSHFDLREPMLPRSQCTPYAFSQALKELGLAVPALKQELLNAFFLCIADDGVITEREGELIRAIAAALGCPMPGWKQAA